MAGKSSGWSGVLPAIKFADVIGMIRCVIYLFQLCEMLIALHVKALVA
jgi:hypothetical protein